MTSRGGTCGATCLPEAAPWHRNDACALKKFLAVEEVWLEALFYRFCLGLARDREAWKDIQCTLRLAACIPTLIRETLWLSWILFLKP